MGFLRGKTGGAHAATMPTGRRASHASQKIIGEIEALGVGSFWATDADGLITYLSGPAMESLGAEAHELIGQPLAAVFAQAPLDDEDRSQRTLAFQLGSHSKIENQIVRIGGGETPDTQTARTRWWRITGKPCFDAKGEFCGYRGNSIDITADYGRQREAAQQSQYDPLTGLANRRRIHDRLTTLLLAYKVAGRSCALMMLDLDRFKQVNDTLGHPAGDELLKQVAERLKTVVKDKGEIGRLGGDEFKIILPDIDDRGELASLAARLIQMLSQPYSVGGNRAIIGASVGVAIAPYDGVDPDEITAAADLALYAAKCGGRGVFRFYTADLKEAASRGRRIEEDLRDALAGGELTLRYQPLVNPNDNSVSGFEALMRWEPADSDLVPPTVFIPIAEQTDLIVQMGAWALRQACDDAVSWPGQLRVAVNVSAKQFMHDDFAKIVASALANSGLEPWRLDLEITESVFVGEVEAVDKVFAALKRLGVRLSMDDFGTGYSSLGYLNRAPFDKIKIDQSFVRGCTDGGATNPAIISAIVALAKALDMETVAEGVEAMDEFELVRQRGVDLVQGYIFARPLTQEALMRRFASGDLRFSPSGPPRYRADRMTLYRKIGLVHEDHYYNVTLRNLSKTGAWIEGLANVPLGTEFVLDLGAGQLVVGTVMRATEIAQGLKFESELIADGAGGLMTRHRVSPYSLMAAGLPLTALPTGAFSVAHQMTGNKGKPRFMLVTASIPGREPVGE